MADRYLSLIVEFDCHNTQYFNNFITLPSFHKVLKIAYEIYMSTVFVTNLRVFYSYYFFAKQATIKAK